MKRSAFTLVEVLATTVLTAILMLVVMRVISGLPRVQEIMDHKAKAARVPQRLVALVRWDLANAQTLGVPSRNLVVLQGYGSLDSDSGIPTHRPVRVVYEIKSSGDESWLVRQQRVLTGSATMRTELLCPGVSGFDLTSAEATPVNPNATGVTGGMGIPVAVTLMLTFKEPGSPTYTEVLVP